MSRVQQQNNKNMEGAKRTKYKIACVWKEKNKMGREKKVATQKYYHWIIKMNLCGKKIIKV